MLYNLHTHTYRCNHADGEDREYIECAIKSGIKVLGISDHCPQFFPNTDYYSHFRMKPELAKEYVDSFRSLAKEYENDIKILIGFETEYASGKKYKVDVPQCMEVKFHIWLNENKKDSTLVVDFGDNQENSIVFAKYDNEQIVDLGSGRLLI